MLRISAPAVAMTLLAAMALPAFAQQSAVDAAPAKGGGPADAKVIVASVRLANGYRASRIIGASVYNGQNEQVGTISDLYLSKQDEVAMAIVSIGGVLGIGAKLVSVPFDKLQINDGNKVVIPGGSKDELRQMPSVEYSD